MHRNFFYHQQTSEDAMRVFTTVELDEFFTVKPCEVDAKRYYELLTSLQEDGSTMLSDDQG